MKNIKWNEVTWYSKMIALIIFIILPFVFFYYGVQIGIAVGYLGGTQTMTAANSRPGSSYYNNPGEWQTDDNNTSGGFAISYPIDFDAQDNYSVAPSADWRLGANGVPGVKYFTLTVPRAFEPQTNFIDAKLTVGASANDAAVAECTASGVSDGPAMTPTSTATVNGINFTVFTSEGAGAGNYYDTTSYRTLHAGKCYAVEYTVHSSQIADYPPSYGLKPFDEGAVNSLMQRIVGTFKFD